MKNTNIVNNFNNYEIESNKAKNDIIKKEPEQKEKNEIFKVNYSEVPKKPSNNMNKTQKNEDLSNININININESTKNKPDIINSTIFRYIIDSIRIINKTYENKVENKEFHNDFKQKMNQKLIDILNHYNIERPSDIIQKKGIKEDITISYYLKKLSNKINRTNLKRHLSEPLLKQIYRIIDELINDKNNNNIKNKKKKIEFRKGHIINIIKNTIIETFILLFNNVNQSYQLKSVGDKKKNDDYDMEEEHKENIKDYNNEDIIDDDFIEKEDYFKPFCLEEKDINLKELIEDREGKNYEDEEEFDNEMEIESDDKENEKINKINEDIKNEKKGKEKDEKTITINISIKNKNITEEDLDFMKKNFENIINEAKKKHHLEHLEESEKARELIKKPKYTFLKALLSNDKEKFFAKIQNNKENRWKNEIYQEITEKIVQRKDLDGLVIILFYYEQFIYNKRNDYKDKDEFFNEIKELGVYEEFISKYDDIENNIKIYMEKVEKIASNIVNNFEKKDLIKKEKIEKKKKFK